MFFSQIQLEALNTSQVHLTAVLLKHRYLRLPNTLQKAGLQGWAELNAKHLLKPARTERQHI